MDEAPKYKINSGLMAYIFRSKFRFMVYLFVGWVIIVVSGVLTAATMPLIIHDFTYQGHGGYEGGGVLGMQFGILIVILGVVLSEILIASNGTVKDTDE